MNDGRFISFEGSEGCGKSTQIGRLARRLEDLGETVMLVREPGGTVIGEKIRELLQFTPEASGMVPEAELLLFTASRAQLVREKVMPALERGVFVIADRFLDSTTVYQGGARGLERDAVEQINRFAVGGCLPHTTFLLDLDSTVGRSRSRVRGGPADRMEQEPDAFYQAVREGYLALAEAEPDRFVVVDAAKPPEEVESEVWEVLVSRNDGLSSR
jgi:dTMP kinase